MEPTRLRLGELLVDARIITSEQLTEVLEIQKEDGRRLGILLVERGLVNETQLTQILSQQLSVPWVSLYHVDFSKRLLSMVPRDVAVKYCLVPIYVRHVRGQGDTLYVAMYDPTNVEALRICAAWSGLPTRAMIASPSDIRNAIDVYYGPGPEGEAQVAADTSSEATAKASQSEASDEESSSVAVSPGQAPAEERFAVEPRPEAEPPAQPIPAEEQEPAGELEVPAAAPAEQPAIAEEPAPAAHGELAYDDSVTVEVGREVPIDEVLSRRPPPEPEEVGESVQHPSARTKAARMMALTLLDGTTLALPMNRAKKPRRDSLVAALRGTGERRGEPAAATTEATPPSQPPLAADGSASSTGTEASASSDAGSRQSAVVEALRAAARGGEPGEALGGNVRWETMAAAILSLMLRKGLITDDEIAEELKKS